jgi:hypothetical protein
MRIREAGPPAATPETGAGLQGSTKPGRPGANGRFHPFFPQQIGIFRHLQPTEGDYREAAPLATLLLTVKYHAPKISRVYFLIPYIFGLVVFFFGFTDLPRMREEAFPLFCLFLVLVAIPAVVDAPTSGRRRKQSSPRP